MYSISERSFTVNKRPVDNSKASRVSAYYTESMNEGGPKKENWDLFIKNPEDKNHTISALKKILEETLLSPSFWEIFVDSPVDPLGFENIRDYVTALIKAHPDVKEELEAWLEIGDLKTIADIQKYSESKNIKLNIKKIILENEASKKLKPEEIN